MSANPHANGGDQPRALRMPDFRDYAVEVPAPGTGAVEATSVLGTFLRDVMVLNTATRNFRVFAPDENNRLQDDAEHPHGLSAREFDTLFTTDKPVVFAYHGYPWLIHRLTHRRTNHPNIHVRGYKEEGTTTTPFDMCVLNQVDRFHLAIDVIDRTPMLRAKAAYARQDLQDKLIAPAVRLRARRGPARGQ